MSADPEEIDDYIALIANHDRQLLKTIASRLPENKNYRRFDNESEDDIDAAYVSGYNAAINQITTILDEIKGEL
jgi:hypothetical protein